MSGIFPEVIFDVLFEEMIIMTSSCHN